MNTPKAIITLIILSGIQQELHTCSFLRRYGTNSYITNIPLFFKQQNTDTPKKTNAHRHRINKSAIITNEPIVIEATNKPNAISTSKPVTTLAIAAKTAQSASTVETSKTHMIQAEKKPLNKMQSTTIVALK